MEETRVRIGLEIHCQLLTKSKLFCSCPTDYRGREPNTVVCPTCLGLPGALPVVNRKAVEYAIMVALALNCRINEFSLFYRKNYFYPDMAKNYQISMYDFPIGENGYVEIKVDGESRKIRIRRIHLEEDPARIVHKGTIDTAEYCLVDYNRSGVPLVEIVTEPDLRSPKEARIFLNKLRSILEHLGVFDGSLEGSMRCDANISIEGGARVEIKNISGFKAVERALNFEIARQKNLMKMGLAIRRETRHYDDARKITVSLRTKEEESDYRYFPEPDLVPLEISKSMIEKIRSRLPELPDERAERFVRDYGIPKRDAEVLVSSKSLADFFEECARIYDKPKVVANWIMTELLQCLYFHDLELEESGIDPEKFVKMLRMIDKGVISAKIGKKVLDEIVKTGKDPEVIVREKGLLRISDEGEIRRIVEEVFRENAKAVEDALRDEKAINYLIGQVMKKTRGRADPHVTNRIVRELLEDVRRGIFKLEES